MARTMLIHCNVPQSLWAQAVSTAVHILNRSPTSSLAGITPFEAYFGRKPDVSYFWVFGCDAYVHIPKVQRGKFDEKSKKVIFVGYNAVSTGYRLYDSDFDAIIVGRDVVFDELSSLEGADSSLDMLGDPSDSFSPSSPPFSPSCDDVPVDGASDVGENPSQPLWARKTLEDLGVDVSTLELQPSSGPRCSQQLKDKASIANVLHTNYSLMLCVLVAQEPTNVGEALQQCVWREAMEVELASIEKNGTWELVPHPPS